MEPPHILFISAGEHIHETFPLCVRKLDGITHAFVVVEEAVYIDDEKDPDHLKKTKPLIRKAIEQVKSISEKLGIAFEEIRVRNTTTQSIRDAILVTAHQNAEARYTFNLSGGTKALSLSLFLLAIWLDGDIVLTPSADTIERFPVPRMHLDEVRRNPNYAAGIEILAGVEDSAWMTRKDFSRRMEHEYKPVRFVGDSKTSTAPNRGTITKIVQQLIEWELVEEAFMPGNKREKRYRLTDDGRFARAILKAEEK